MFLKLLISSVILVGIIMFTASSCALKEGDPDGEGACSLCHNKDISNCSINK